MDGTIYIMNADGTDQRTLAPGDMAVWFPYRREVIIVNIEGGGASESFSVRTVDIDTGEERVLFQADKDFDISAVPDISTNGNQLALAWGEPGEYGTTVLYNIYLNTGEIVPLSSGGGGGTIDILGWTSDNEWLVATVGGDNYFIHRQGACWVSLEPLEDLDWLAFSGYGDHLFVWYEGDYYVIDLHEALGPDFPDGVLECP
ncbi:MAG: hypothetical protein GF414_01455 [Candidatus Altiarchaeales archaeon]|nr:hypothetical protein [Candidatus Altiarchaeales archaeon]